MGKIEHSCCGGITPGGRYYPCLCGTCKHDTGDCCIKHAIMCPEFVKRQKCPDYEAEEEDNDGA